MKKKNKINTGFTLIELLLALALFAVVMASCYGIFSMGIQIWRRTQGPLLAERKAVLALEKIAQDLRATFPSTREEITGSGNSTQLAVPAIIQHGLRDGTRMTQVGKVLYEWRRRDRTLCRTKESATVLFSKRTAPCRVVARDIEKLRFQYWTEKLAGSYSWYDEFDEDEGLPRAVRMTLTLRSKLKNGKFAARKNYIRTVILPTAGQKGVVS